jgi:hypothetical protein
LGVLLKHAMDGGTGDEMSFRDLAEALTSSPIPYNGNMIDVERAASDVSTLKPSPAHSCADPFDDQIPFQLGDRPDDDDDGPAQRAAGIQVLPEADELDAEMVEFVENLEEVPDGPGDPVRGPYQDHLEAAAAGIPQQVIETRAPGLGPRDPVSVLGDDLKTPLLGHGAEIMKLSLRVLVDSGYAQIKGYCLHIFSFIESTMSRR